MRRRCRLGSIGERPEYSEVSVCDRWEVFSNFLEDMGERPEGMTLDRVDPRGNYSPDNCRWATPSQQQRNKRVNRTLSYKGETKSLHDWADEVGIGAMTIYKRIEEYGWSAEKALTTPPYKGGNYKSNGTKDHTCPHCGKEMSKGNLTQHLRSPNNPCGG